MSTNLWKGLQAHLFQKHSGVYYGYLYSHTRTPYPFTPQLLSFGPLRLMLAVHDCVLSARRLLSKVPWSWWGRLGVLLRGVWPCARCGVRGSPCTGLCPPIARLLGLPEPPARSRKLRKRVTKNLQGCRLRELRDSEVGLSGGTEHLRGGERRVTRWPSLGAPSPRRPLERQSLQTPQPILI